MQICQNMKTCHRINRYSEVQELVHKQKEMEILPADFIPYLYIFFYLFLIVTPILKYSYLNLFAVIKIIPLLLLLL